MFLPTKMESGFAVIRACFPPAEKNPDKFATNFRTNFCTWFANNVGFDDLACSAPGQLSPALGYFSVAVTQLAQDISLFLQANPIHTEMMLKVEEVGSFTHY
jgi:hypothetical protein